MTMPIKTFAITTVAVAALTAAALGSARPTAAAPSRPTSVTDLVRNLDSNNQNLALILGLVT
jgi:hypothetical protein